MSARLHAIVLHMTEYLDRAALKTVILNAIPSPQPREFFPTEPTRRPGLPRTQSWQHPTTVISHSSAYIAEYPDTDALEYLDLIREVVSARNPATDAENRDFLLEEYATYAAKTRGVPTDFHPILLLFKQWCDLTSETERDAALSLSREARNALSQLKQDIAREKATTERLTTIAERNSSETAEERTERVRDEKSRAAHRERYFSAL